MSEITQRFAQELRNRIDPSRAAGMTAVYQFVISDDTDGAVHANIVNGAIDVAEGRAAIPDITLTATAADWLAIVKGELSGQMGFLMGKLKIQGDMTLALKLQSVFHLG
jgi:putative sterol carrier protein